MKLTSNRLSTCFNGMQSDVQHLGGIWAGSLTDSLKLRFKHDLHIRCPHFSLAVFVDGRSSRQTTHSTLFTHTHTLFIRDGLFWQVYHHKKNETRTHILEDRSGGDGSPDAINLFRRADEGLEEELILCAVICELGAVCARGSAGFSYPVSES